MKEHYLQSLPAWKELWTESQAVDSKASPSQLQPRPWIHISWAITLNEKVGNDDLHGFPNSSVGKESTCNAGDPSLIPGLGRSAGEGIGTHSNILGLPLWLSWLRICLQCGRPEFNPWVGKIPWRRQGLPTPVFWPGEFHGLYSPWGRKELDMTEWLSLPWFPLVLIIVYYCDANKAYISWSLSLFVTPRKLSKANRLNTSAAIWLQLRRGHPWLWWVAGEAGFGLATSW